MRSKKPVEPKTLNLVATHGSTSSRIEIFVPDHIGPLLDDWQVMEIVLSLRQKGWAIRIAT